MKKMFKFFYEIYVAISLAHKWHTKFRQVLQFVRADRCMQKEISKAVGIINEDDDQKGV